MNRQKLNEKRYKIGQNIEISFVQLLSLIVINLSLVSVILNLFLKGRGNMDQSSIWYVDKPERQNLKNDLLDYVESIIRQGEAK
jgi:hypothetical protein